MMGWTCGLDGEDKEFIWSFDGEPPLKAATWKTEKKDVELWCETDSCFQRISLLSGYLLALLAVKRKVTEFLGNSSNAPVLVEIRCLIYGVHKILDS
jgi:hypothetical protein